MDTNRQIKDYFQYTKIRSTKSLLLLKAQCYSPNTLSVLLFTKPVNILPDIFPLTRRAVSILAYISFSFMQCHCTIHCTSKTLFTSYTILPQENLLTPPLAHFICHSKQYAHLCLTGFHFISVFLSLSFSFSLPGTPFQTFPLNLK